MSNVQYYRMINEDEVILVKTNVAPHEVQGPAATPISQEEYEEGLASIMKDKFVTMTMSDIDPDPTIGEPS